MATMSAASTLQRHILRRLLLRSGATTQIFFSFRINSVDQTTGALTGGNQRRTSSTNKSIITDSSSPSSIQNLRASKQQHRISPSLNPTVDWREWFRSSDYDDPWSAYQPFTNNNTQESSTAKNKSKVNDDYKNTLIPSILNGSWKRRRHGMNLEPINVVYNYHNSNDVDHELREDEDEEGAQRAINEKKAQKAQWNDAQSRFLCRMLDDMYRTGIRRETDGARTDRCHRAISRLLTMTPENPSRETDDITINGLAQRAGSILQRMELCSTPALLQIRIKQKKSSSNSEEDSTLHDESTKSSEINGSTSPSMGGVIASAPSYQNIYPDYPRHLTNTKFELPTPTRQIYNMVLKAYAKEVGPIHIAQQAEDVVWSMIVRAYAMHQGQYHSEDVPMDQSNDDDGGKDENYFRMPSLENWNCVLKCWSRCTDPDRAFYAYSFLLSWWEWNEQRQVDGTVEPDMESFHLVLQTCLVPEDEITPGSKEMMDYQRAREMGSGVAIRLWKELQGLERIAPFDSTTYYMIIQAICQTSELPSSSSSSRALGSLVRVFKRCCKEGMDTPEILDLVRAATTKAQFTQLTEKKKSSRVKKK